MLLQATLVQCQFSPGNLPSPFLDSAENMGACFPAPPPPLIRTRHAAAGHKWWSSLVAITQCAVLFLRAPQLAKACCNSGLMSARELQFFTVYYGASAQ